MLRRTKSGLELGMLEVTLVLRGELFPVGNRLSFCIISLREETSTSP